MYGTAMEDKRLQTLSGPGLQCKHDRWDKCLVKSLSASSLLRLTIPVFECRKKYVFKDGHK